MKRVKFSTKLEFGMEWMINKSTPAAKNQSVKPITTSSLLRHEWIRSMLKIDKINQKKKSKHASTNYTARAKIADNKIINRRKPQIIINN